ncbi:Hypothetical protein HEAR3025 [Herminiimonas arsenicoxydans]|uniref:Uncharacterized protein n=1 Tax=Herminiimonas arsenicoxydans TaxID=204773 RepID=A4G9E7_HERAR|nr:Hypothetical protein HEAR3025 [Herminiimonas arsenicoxydans]
MTKKHSTQDAGATEQRSMQLSIVPHIQSSEMQAANLALIANFSRMSEIDKEMFLGLSESLSAKAQKKDHLKIVGVTTFGE